MRDDADHHGDEWVLRRGRELGGVGPTWNEPRRVVCFSEKIHRVDFYWTRECQWGHQVPVGVGYKISWFWVVVGFCGALFLLGGGWEFRFMFPRTVLIGSPATTGRSTRDVCSRLMW